MLSMSPQLARGQYVSLLVRGVAMPEDQTTVQRAALSEDLAQREKMRKVGASYHHVP